MPSPRRAAWTAGSGVLRGQRAAARLVEVVSKVGPIWRAYFFIKILSASLRAAGKNKNRVARARATVMPHILKTFFPKVSWMDFHRNLVTTYYLAQYVSLTVAASAAPGPAGARGVA